MNICIFSILNSSISCFIAFFLWQGCNNNTNKISEVADFSGYITEVKILGDGEGLIKAESYIDKLIQRWEIAVNNNTRLIRKETEEPISLSSLQVTDRIQVWFFSTSKKDNLNVAAARQIILTSRKGE